MRTGTTRPTGAVTVAWISIEREREIDDQVTSSFGLPEIPFGQFT